MLYVKVHTGELKCFREKISKISVPLRKAWPELNDINNILQMKNLNFYVK